MMSMTESDWAIWLLLFKSVFLRILVRMQTTIEENIPKPTPSVPENTTSSKNFIVIHMIERFGWNLRSSKELNN